MTITTYEKLQFSQVRNLIESHCVSTLGKARFKKLDPSSNPVVVNKRYQETEEARKILDAKLTMPFMGLAIVESLFQQLEKGLILEASGLIEMADFLRSGRMIRRFMEKHGSLAPTLGMYARSIHEYIEIEEEIYFSIKNGQVASEASKELKRVRRLMAEKESKIEERLTKFLKNKSNQKQIQEFFVSKKNERYTIPIKAAYKNQVAGTIVETSTKGTTVFIEPDVVTKLNDELTVLKMEESVEMYQILATLSGLLIEQIQEIQLNLEVIAEYDMIFARGKYSRAIQGVTPKLNQEGYIQLIQGRHPLLNTEEAVPLDFTIGKTYHGLIITGPNAGGKTVVLKTVGLLALMTLLGIQLPADAGTEMAIFAGVFVDIGDSQSLENALSTFSSHIQNIAEIMQTAPTNSLVLFDEIGSGTEPNEGAGLAIAILEEFYERGNCVVATTHYGEIKRYSELHPDFINAAMAFDQTTLTPLYKLLIGESGDSNALWIAKKMNLKTQVLQQAKQYMENKEYQLEKRKIKSAKVQAEHDKASVPISAYEKGDRVLLLEFNETGLVYEDNPLNETITIFYKDELHEIVPKRLKLEVKAAKLYPIDYNLDSLFSSYQTRKLEHDIQRGSKKALKKIHREIKAQKK
ncbi:endonuclease MutS2 [Carnobacterium gallinarum]|uniref:endonuclease MutS2 n=1 Tax=Carnobacterium gallinarum TaxID=2749 RepID=UPI0005549CB7|nr:mannonate oxidoreductase [Carnobacterium gallinarum]